MDHVRGRRTNSNEERCFRSTTRDHPILCRREFGLVSSKAEVNLNEANTGNGNYYIVL